LSNEIIRTFSSQVPTFGVCLGHQCIGHVFGGNVVVNYRMMHGKTSLIKHNGKDLFVGMPNPFAATRYHSLVIQRESLPDCLEITAETDEGEIMGVKHKQLPIWGVQFHPESILTENGRQILGNFLKLGTCAKLQASNAKLLGNNTLPNHIGHAERGLGLDMAIHQLDVACWGWAMPASRVGWKDH